MVIVQDSPSKLTSAMPEDRLVDFAVRLIAVAKHLERDTAGRTIAPQLLRAGTSPAANYAEARSAESRADFAHKLCIVIKELKRSIGASLGTAESRTTPANKP